MPEQLILDYRTGGSSVLNLGEPVEDDLSRLVLDRTRMLLVSRGNEAAIQLFDALDFHLRHASNGFGDEFFAIVAQVSPQRLAEYRVAQRPVLDRAAQDLRLAADNAHEGEEEVRFIALTLADNIVRGLHGEYAFEEREHGRGGFATVHRARDAQGKLLALKRLYVRDEEAAARLRREIQEQQRIVHRAVMPIVDHDPAYRWFVMPFADENMTGPYLAATLHSPLLLHVLRTAAHGLAAAHALGLVHRDVSPRNLLRVGSQWVVGDWGVVRRPRGMTTLVRTQGELGTNGFAAPELFRDAHEAGPAADVYALGRLAAWATTRKWPDQNRPLLPEGPWRHFVRRTTELEASRRVQTMQDVLSLLDEVERDLWSPEASGGSSRHPTPPELVGRLPDRAAARELLELGAASLDDADLFLDCIAHVDAGALDAFVHERPDDADALVTAMEGHVLDRHRWVGRDFNSSNRVIAWLRSAATVAVGRRRDGLLEDAATALFRAEARCDGERTGSEEGPEEATVFHPGVQGGRGSAVQGGRPLDRAGRVRPGSDGDVAA